MCVPHIWSSCCNRHKLCSLLGFIGHYRSFIQDFLGKAKLLYDLLCKDKEKGKLSKKSSQRPSSDKIVW